MRSLALDASDDGGEILPPLGLETLDQVRAGLFVEFRVITVVALPDPAACRVNIFLETGDGVAGRELREAVLAIHQQTCARRQTCPT
jgi:hypothetical protein